MNNPILIYTAIGVSLLLVILIIILLVKRSRDERSSTHSQKSIQTYSSAARSHYPSPEPPRSFSSTTPPSEASGYGTTQREKRPVLPVAVIIGIASLILLATGFVFFLRQSNTHTSGNLRVLVAPIVSSLVSIVVVALIIASARKQTKK